MTPQPIFICTTPGFQIIEETQTIAACWLGEVLGPASLRDAATDEALGLLGERDKAGEATRRASRGPVSGGGRGTSGESRRRAGR